MNWIISITCIALALLIIGGNAIAGWRATHPGRSYSSVPFVAAIFGIIGCLLAPRPGLRWAALAFLFADYTVPGFLYAVFHDRALSRSK